MSQTGIRVMFNHCIHLHESLYKKHVIIAYCLKFHDWLDQCPKKCQEYVHGEVGKIIDIERKRFNIECLHFNRKFGNNGSSPIYYCSLMMQEDPFCHSCQFPSYKENI
ncbi:MAG: hypothetical protein ACFE8U_04655 [Candidatus Hermodarchaeota archaeon]